jgi:acyl-CoA hydrolase
MEGKCVNESRVQKMSRVFPTDLNNHGTLFGGKILAEMDMLASISASRHARMECVTASMDSVDFLCPIRETDSVCYESFVIWTGTSSMEVFVKVIAEDLMSGHKRVAATSFVTFVALKKDGKAAPVPRVIPETEEEQKLYEIAVLRASRRQSRKEESKRLAALLAAR